jgi:SAM-dependent methyltransferase
MMEKSAIERMAEIEGRHWWFASRRRIITSIITRLHLTPSARIMEAGCGSGGNLAMLSNFGEVSAFEYDAVALEPARGRKIGKVEPGHLPDAIPFAPQKFDLIAALDVLEHVTKDKESVQALAERLNKNGFMLVTVPAYQWLWDRHDEIHHHKRRYTKSGLIKIFEHAGMKIEYASYFNSLLFPLMLLQRLLEKYGIATNADKMPPAWLNNLLTVIFVLEKIWLGKLAMPFGGSILLIARHNEDAAREYATSYPASDLTAQGIWRQLLH